MRRSPQSSAMRHALATLGCLTVVAASPGSALGSDAVVISPGADTGASISITNNGGADENAVAIGPVDYSSDALTSLALPGASSCQASGSQGGWYCYVVVAAGATVTGTFTAQQPVAPGRAYAVCTTTDSFATDACANVAAGSASGQGNRPPCPEIRLDMDVSEAVTGQPVTGTVSANGGSAPYTYAKTGPLPQGVSLSSSGALSGTPASIQDSSEDYQFAVTATDSAGCTATQEFTIDVFQAEESAVVTVPPSGRGSAPADCPPGTAEDDCTVQVVLTADPNDAGVRRAGAARRRVVVGRGSGTVKAGTTGRIPFRLNARGRALLARRHRLAVRVSGVRVQSRTTTHTGSRLTIRQPKRHRH